MATNNIFLDYANFVSELQNQIMKIQFRYNECQSVLSSDYEKGLIEKEVFEKLYNCRMDQFFEEYSSKYVLTMDEVSFLKNYADLDNEGKVLSTILKSIYLRKNQLFADVLKSVGTFAYYNSFDFYTKRNTFKELYIEAYTNERDKILEAVQRIKSAYGSDNPNSSKYKILMERLDKVNSALSYSREIINLDDKKFNELVASFYKVKQYYYEWFIKMQLKEEYQKGTVFTEHLVTVDNLQQTINSSVQVREQYHEETMDALNISKCLSKFLEEFMNFDYEEIADLEKKKHFSFSRKNDNNLDVLYKVFGELLKLFGVKFYIDNNFDCDEETLDKDKEIFNLYMKRNYGDITYVSIEDFIKRFRRCVVNYYKKLLVEYDKVFKKHDEYLESTDKKLKSLGDSSLVQARLIEQIHYGYTGTESVLLSGFTLDEVEKMYVSLKEYIANGFTFADDSKTMRKV